MGPLQGLRATAHEGLIKLLEDVCFTHCGAENDGDARAILPAIFVESSFRQRHASGRERHRGTPSHASQIGPAQVVARAKFFHLAGNRTPEVLRRKLRDLRSATLARGEGTVERLFARTDRAENPHAGDEHP